MMRISAFKTLSLRKRRVSILPFHGMQSLTYHLLVSYDYSDTKRCRFGSMRHRDGTE